MRRVVAVEPGGPEVLVVEEAPLPGVGPHQVRIRNLLAGINFADINARRATYAHRGTRFPFVPGLEAMGVVEAVGEGVDEALIGRRVAAFPIGGAYAEAVVAPADLVMPIPDRVDDAQAAAFPVVGLTAYHLLVSVARARPGESVVITAAAGGVGTTAVQVSRLLGLSPIIAAAGSARRARHAISLGATHAVDYSSQDLAVAVLEATEGRGADIVLDAVGGEVREAGFRSLGVLGRLVQFGNSSGQPESQPSPLESRERAIGSCGFHLGRLRGSRPDLIRSGAARLLEWMQAGELRIEVGEHVPLTAVREAHRRLESRQVVGKLLLDLRST